MTVPQPTSTPKYAIEENLAPTDISNYDEAEYDDDYDEETPKNSIASVSATPKPTIPVRRRKVNH